MKTIRELFNNKLFRIPDYQRGYSWEESHLADFWQDLSNLQKNRIHYTGMISVEEVSKTEYQKWKDDKWAIEGKSDKPYFVVDGQQRLTTVIILLWVILNELDDDEELSFESKKTLIDKYIYAQNEKKNLKSYVFGYHKDNPSYQFLKREIFEQDDYDLETELEETAYTNNLLYAKRFFTSRVKKMSVKDREILYNKITKRLKFDFKILEKELDIFIVFETMNNRGKPLSNLERLKNRLIYLSTLFKNSEKDEELLRDQVNEHWKIIYKYLGLNKDRRLDDDSFLQSHWIMYERYDRREPEFYAKDIFEKYFTSQNVLNGELEYGDIQKYIQSISLGVKQWFIMYNPSHSHALELTGSSELLFWLKKQNRLGFKAFSPLIMGAFVKEKELTVKIDLIKAIESYVFLIFNVSFRRSNTGTYHFNAKASELYKGNISAKEIINDIKFWIHGDEISFGYFDINNFRSFLKDLFVREESTGFHDWKYIKYFLYEYELYLNDQNEYDNDWNTLTNVMTIYPSAPVQRCWKLPFKKFNNKEKKNLSGSLGNFILTSNRNKIKEEKCFDDQKKYFANGSLNENELLSHSEWEANSILERGLKLLNFMEKRWDVSIGDYEDKKNLLFLDFLSLV